jgi:hypothetical protein
MRGSCYGGPARAALWRWPGPGHQALSSGWGVKDRCLRLWCSLLPAQEMKHRTYYLSNGTIRVAGKLITRCAEPYAEGDLISIQLDMDARQISFLKNNMLQGAGDGLPGALRVPPQQLLHRRTSHSVSPTQPSGGHTLSATQPPLRSRICVPLSPTCSRKSVLLLAAVPADEVWPYVSLDNIMDSITLHSSSMFVDLAHSLRWNPARASKHALLSADGQSATLRPVVSPATGALEETSGQATVMGLREYGRTEVHSWIVR